MFLLHSVLHYLLHSVLRRSLAQILPSMIEYVCSI